MKTLYRKLVGYRTRVQYWSCSKFADKLREIFHVEPKPQSATMEQWKKWHETNQASFGYWVTEELLDVLQDIVMFVPDVYQNLRRFIVNWLIDKPHCLDTKLPRGQWYEFDQRVLYGVFEALVDFVEIEKAHLHRASMWLREQESLDDITLYRAAMKLRRSPRRSREDGLKYLQWEMTLVNDNPRQAEVAKEIYDLYIWWKDIRPSRVDPWSLNEDQMIDSNGQMCFDFGQKYTPCNDPLKVEEEQYKEDNEMLKRLIDIRRECWT